MTHTKRWGDKRYRSLNVYLRQRHGQKVGKLSLNAGLNCPNRDGAVSFGGCVFCGEDGSGTFAGPHNLSIASQIEHQKHMQNRKWNVDAFVAYFQSYSNTYAEVSKLRTLYNEAINVPQVCALGIATRPDCLSDDVLDLLESYNAQTHLWVELGLQTIHEKTAQWINRGYTLDVFQKAVHRLKSKGIEVVVHIILGLPGETEQDMLKTASYLARLGVDGIKIHLLHVVEGTKLARQFQESPLPILSQDAYTTLVVKVLERLPERVVIHRLTGDGAKDTLVAPRWPLHKRAVLNEIDKKLREQNTWQGKCFRPQPLE